MSTRLTALLTDARAGGFQNDHERFCFLQDWLSEPALQYTHPVDPMRAMLDRYSAATPTDRLESWAKAAETLAGSLSDPDDMLYGLLIASEVWALGLEYDLKDMSRFLERMRDIPSDGEQTGDASQDAYERYELLLNRIMDMDAMLQGELDDGEIVPWEWSRNPDVLANAMDLFYRTTKAYVVRVETEEEREIDAEEMDSLVEWSGHALWACYHAAEEDVPFEELAEFVRVYEDDWSDILRDLLRDGVLARGILLALTETRATADQVVESGAEAVLIYRTSAPPIDMTLVEYLDSCLTAVTLDA